jgi:hypothetical protein
MSVAEKINSEIIQPEKKEIIQPKKNGITSRESCL